MPNNTPTESQDQIKIVQYLEILERQWKVLWFTGSGNWQFQKSMAVKMKMKREWIRAGMPDLFIVFQSQIVLIELKRLKGGKPTEEQIKAVESINKVWDKVWWICAFITYWFDETKKIIDHYCK